MKKIVLCFAALAALLPAFGGLPVQAVLKPVAGSAATEAALAQRKTVSTPWNGSESQAKNESAAGEHSAGNVDGGHSAGSETRKNGAESTARSGATGAAEEHRAGSAPPKNGAENTARSGATGTAEVGTVVTVGAAVLAGGLGLVSAILALVYVFGGRPRGK